MLQREVTVEYGENSVFDVKKVQSHLCQTCPDKLLEVMESYGEEGKESGAKDVCLVADDAGPDIHNEGGWVLLRSGRGI